MALIHIGGKSYELIVENKSGWKPEIFRERYSEVLERYDYIVGDWGYNQLRLKGFFKDNYQKAAKDSIFSSVSDYINEYCNFGCAYFILEKKESARRDRIDDESDLDQEKLRLDGADIRAAIEEAQNEAMAASGEIDTAFQDIDIPNIRQRNNRGDFNRDSGGTSRRDHSRKGNRGHSHRGKKPVNHAANEAAAASTMTVQLEKDAKRS